jgi:alpha-L-rhamnosidase
VLIAPRPGGDLSWARSALETRHGRVAVDWRLEDADLRLDVELPDGVTGLVRLPDGTERELAGGRHTITT